MSPPRLSLASLIYIGLGGILGSILRTWIGIDYTGGFPVPTILVNILGASALGILHASQHRLHPDGKYLYMVGFCGSFTTVSLFSFESLELFANGHSLQAILNLVVPVLAAFLIVYWIVARFDRPTKESPG